MRGPGDRASEHFSSPATTRSSNEEVHAGQTKARPVGVQEFGTRTKSLLHENREISGGSRGVCTQREARGRREP